MSSLIKDFFCQSKKPENDRAVYFVDFHSQKTEARWIAYYNQPVGTFMYLCDECLCATIKENSEALDNRLISVRFLFDALNQIGGSGVLSSLPSR